jgi:hypothetical protein
MKNQNKVLLWHIVGEEHLILDYFQTETTLNITADDVCGTLIEAVHEVWHSPTGFDVKDDAVSIGFILLPFIVHLDEHNCKYYRLSPLSTTITERFLHNWKLILPVPQVSVEHQKRFYPYLFIR